MIIQQEERKIQIIEQRGLWKASAFIRKLAKRFIKKNKPISIRYIIEAHKILYSETKEKDLAGKYRRENPKIKRIDDSTLKIPHWKEVPHLMAILDDELKAKTSHTIHAFSAEDYAEIIDLAVKTSHRLACIHPFFNGNGRMSRLLIDFLLFRMNLPSIAIKEDKKKYLQAMFQADKGDFSLLRRLALKGLTQSQKKKLYARESKLTTKGKKVTVRKDNFRD